MEISSPPSYSSLGSDFLNDDLRQFLNGSSKKSLLLSNPALSLQEHEKELLDLNPQHIWLTTSGTTSARKWIALSRSALLESAQAVNQHLKVQPQDIWINVLPLFHVGGLSLPIRGFLSSSPVVNLSDTPWSPLFFLEQLNYHKATLTSLVPSQVFDLVKKQLRPPPSLRAVVVGGGSLSLSLYSLARKLNWPLLPSFGMTECSSQIATASLESLHLPLESPSAQASSLQIPPLEVLPHVQVRTDLPDDGLWIRSLALLTAFAIWKDSQWKIQDPKQKDGWFLTEDRAKITSHFLVPLGRQQEQAKILGELVSLPELRLKAETVAANYDLQGKWELIFTRDLRQQNKIDLVVEDVPMDSALQFKVNFNALVLPFERIHNLYIIKALPRNHLGKIQQKLLRDQLGLQVFS